MLYQYESCGDLYIENVLSYVHAFQGKTIHASRSLIYGFLQMYHF